MNLKTVLSIACLWISGANIVLAQELFTQYFDGADTSAYNALFIEIDTSANNIWQVGTPQKLIFNTAATAPNALVTDTLNHYPPNNTSVFEFEISQELLSPFSGNVMALQWKQKLDMDAGQDGGIIEFSIDDGVWQNAFDNPYVYNFYGYDEANEQTLEDGTIAFSGTDTLWRDIWLCFDIYWAWESSEKIKVRFTFLSDDVENNKEGWLIDNFLAHITLVHTVNEVKMDNYMEVYPNPSNSGRIHIKTEKQQGLHIIEKMELIDNQGKTVEVFGKSPTKFWIDIGHHPNGIYTLKVTTNLRTESFRIVLQK